MQDLSARNLARFSKVTEHQAVFHRHGIYASGEEYLNIPRQSIRDLDIPDDVIAVSLMTHKKIKTDNKTLQGFLQTKEMYDPALYFVNAEIYDESRIDSEFGKRKAKSLQKMRENTDTGLLVKMRNNEIFVFNAKDAVITQDKHGKWKKTTAPQLENKI